MTVNEISYDRPKNHIWLHHHTMMSLVLRLKKTLLILLEDYLALFLCLDNPGSRWMDVLRFSASPKILTVPSATGNMKLSPFIGVNTSFALSLRAWRSATSISSNSSMSATQMSPFEILSRVQDITEECTWQDFRTKLMQSRLVFRGNRVIFDHCSKRYNWSVKENSEPPFIRCFLTRQEILNVPQIAVTFHRICPPFVDQTWLQQHRRCPFLHSAHCSFGNNICFRSVWCWRTMIPG